MHVKLISRGSDGSPWASVKLHPLNRFLLGYINYYLEKMGFSELDNNITLGLFQYENFDS